MRDSPHSPGPGLGPVVVAGTPKPDGSGVGGLGSAGERHACNPGQRRAAAWRSTLLLKAARAVSGLVMVLFLIAHVYGNLKVFSGRATQGALWIIRVVLLVRPQHGR